MEKGDYDYNYASPDRYMLLKEFAEENKKFPTEAESFLWRHLRNRRLGIKFNRQHVIGDYIVDFVALKEKLVVEIDGAYHSELEQMENDQYRTERLEKMGFTVIRFTNEDVLCNIDDTLDDILAKIDSDE